MRKPICYENALAVGDHFLLEGSVKWEEGERIHMVWNFDWNVNNLFGYAHDFKREADGAITAELVFREDRIRDFVKACDLPATFEGSDVVGEMHDNVRVISHVKIRGVTIVAHPQVPW